MGFDLESSINVGERVVVEGQKGEFVVVNVDAETASVELLQLKPGHILTGIPLASVKRRAGQLPDAPRSPIA